MIKSVLLILFYCSLSVAYHGTPVVWDRIPQFKVNDRVTSFLNKQGIKFNMQNKVQSCIDHGMLLTRRVMMETKAKNFRRRTVCPIGYTPRRGD